MSILPSYSLAIVSQLWHIFSRIKGCHEKNFSNFINIDWFGGCFFVQRKRHSALSKHVPAQYELEEKSWTAAVELATFLSYIRKGNEGENAVSQIHRLLEQSQKDDPKIRQYLVLTLGVIADPNSEALLIKLVQVLTRDSRLGLISGLVYSFMPWHLEQSRVYSPVLLGLTAILLGLNGIGWCLEFALRYP